MRLTLLFSATATVIFAVFGWLINQSTEQHFEAGDIAELSVIEQAVEEVLADDHFADDLAAAERRFEDILVGHHRASMCILGEDNEVIYASSGPDLTVLAANPPDPDPANSQVHRWNHGSHSYRVLISHKAEQTAVANVKPHTIAIAVQIDYHLQFLEHFHQTLWVMILTSIIIMSVMGWIAVRQGIAPLHDIVARVRRISADDLNTRLSPESMPVELKDLAVSFNGMLQRVDGAFHRLSDFNADIAHELRTPITNLMTQTQVALSRARTTDEYREILYSNMEEYEHMAQMVGDMLFLAQTDSGPISKNVSDIDLAGEVRALFEYYEGWAEERGVTLQLKGRATVSGDRLMLQRALGNLLSNAIRYTAHGEAVRVGLGTTEDGKVSISVENPGVGIPPEHLHKIFDRFYRVDPSRQRDGNSTGLGLAIVKSIVEAHGGNIDVASTAGHTRFQVTLPCVKT